MDFFIQMINGLGLGSIYALVALGYSMVYGIIQLINFAHGDIIMVGAYVILTAVTRGGMSPVLAVALSVIFCTVLGMVILSIAVCTLLGVVIERLAYHRLLVKDAPRLSLLITAIGVSIFLQNLFQLGFTSSAQSMPVMFPNKVITLGSLQLSFSTVLNILVSIAMMILLELIVNKSKMGKAMRATSEDAGAAKLMGINTNSTIAFTFAIGSALAAVGAVLYSNTFHQITPYMGGMLGLKAFVAAVLGGIGNIPGAMLGGYILGVAESLTIAAGGSQVSDAVVFGILILVLLVKPAGLLGKNVQEKV